MTTKAEKAEIKKQVQKIIFRAKVRSALEEFYAEVEEQNAEVEGQNERKPAYTPNPDGLITFRSLHF